MVSQRRNLVSENSENTDHTVGTLFMASCLSRQRAREKSGLVWTGLEIRPTIEFAYGGDSFPDGLLFQRASCSARNSADRPSNIASRNCRTSRW